MHWAQSIARRQRTRTLRKDDLSARGYQTSSAHARSGPWYFLATRPPRWPTRGTLAWRGFPIKTCYVLAERYWDRSAIEALLSLPGGAVVVVPCPFVRGYARSWSEQFRRDLVILAPEEAAK